MNQADSGRGATPFRVPVTGSMLQGIEELAANAQANSHLPKLGRESLKDVPLAICGGGPSLAGHIDALRAWNGPVWAVNRTPGWLKGRGVASTLVSVDATDDFGAFCEPDAVQEAIFSSWCNPAVVARYNSRTFDMFPLFPDGVVGTTTSAGCLAMLGFRMGYREITLFGCEGSFVDTDHVDRDEQQPDQFIIRADGGDYRTTPDLLVQCDELSRLIRGFPDHLKEQSGGLLRAMAADPDWITVAVSEALADAVFPDTELTDFPL